MIEKFQVVIIKLNFNLKIVDYKEWLRYQCYINYKYVLVFWFYWFDSEFYLRIYFNNFYQIYNSFLIWYNPNFFVI